VEERGDEPSQHVEFCTEGPRGGFWLDAKSACDARADRAREEQGNTERERQGDKAVTRGRKRLAAWIFIILIIWTQLFHCK